MTEQNNAQQTEEEIETIIVNLKNGIESCESEGVMDSASWGREEGVIISGNDAKTILKALSKPTGFSEEEVQQLLINIYKDQGQDIYISDPNLYFETIKTDFKAKRKP